jgi:hypothetical protein
VEDEVAYRSGVPVVLSELTKTAILIWMDPDEGSQEKVASSPQSPLDLSDLNRPDGEEHQHHAEAVSVCRRPNKLSCVA